MRRRPKFRWRKEFALEVEAEEMGDGAMVAGTAMYAVGEDKVTSKTVAAEAEVFRIGDGGRRVRCKVTNP